MMKLSFQPSQRSLPLIVTLTLFSGIGLLLWFGILPFQKFIAEKADSIQEYYATRENRERQISGLPDLQKQFESIVAHEEVLNILLQENHIVDFVKTLEALALSTGTHVEIHARNKDAIEEKQVVRGGKKSDDGDESPSKKRETLTILESVPYDRYLHVDIVVTGDYANIVTFLHKMETLPLGLDVIDLSIKTRDEITAEQKPDNPGSNPFLIFSGDSTSDVIPKEESQEVIPGALEATFDTLVYVSK